MTVASALLMVSLTAGCSAGTSAPITSTTTTSSTSAPAAQQTQLFVATGACPDAAAISKLAGITLAQVTPAGGSGCSYQAEDFGVHLWNSDDFSSDVLPVQNGKPGDRSTLPSGALRSFLDGSLYNTCSVVAPSGGTKGVIVEAKDARLKPSAGRDLCPVVEFLFDAGTQRAGVATDQPKPAATSTSTSTSTTSNPVSGAGTLRTLPFNGYTIELPAGSTQGSAVTGKYGDKRVTYSTPDGQLTTVAFSADFRWREFSEEITGACPQASEGKQTPIDFGGSYKGGYTVWDRSSCGATPLVTFVTFGEVEQVAIVLQGQSAAPGWLIDAVKRARWSD